jgi:hypothetical protein
VAPAAAESTVAAQRAVAVTAGSAADASVQSAAFSCHSHFVSSAADAPVPAAAEASVVLGPASGRAFAAVADIFCQPLNSRGWRQQGAP